MPTIDATNAAIGAAKDDVLAKLMDLLKSDSTATAGEKSAGLLAAQANSGVIDGIINVMGKTYNKFGQTGQ